MSLYLKDPGATIDYAIDWLTGYLDGQTITASTWSVFPQEAGGIAVVGDGFDLGRSAVTVSGGVAGHVYRLTNRVTLSDGRADERSLVLRVEDR